MVPEYYAKYAERIQNTMPTLLLEIPDLLMKLVNIEMAGGEAYLVGGATRDLVYDAYVKRNVLLSTDIDIEVFGLSQEDLESILGLELTGNFFPVYNTSYSDIHNDVKFEVQWALPRRERKIGKGHNGFETPVDPNMSTYEAASRRDLTINSIMLNLQTYEIVDHFHGIDDLIVNRIADCVSPQTFVDDPLRVIRAARFIPKFGLQPSTRLVELSKQMKYAYYELTPELREKELTKLFAMRTVWSGLKFLHDVEWLLFILNQDEQYEYYRTVAGNLLYAFAGEHVANFNNGIDEEYTINRELINWSILLSDRDSENIITFFRDINPNWNNATILAVCKIVYHGNILRKKESKSAHYIGRYLQYKAKSFAGEIVHYLSVVSSYNWNTQILDTYQFFLYREKFPIISGDDILEFIPQGKMVGIVRDFYVNQHIEGVVIDRNQALKMLPNIISLIERGIKI